MGKTVGPLEVRGAPRAEHQGFTIDAPNEGDINKPNVIGLGAGNGFVIIIIIINAILMGQELLFLKEVKGPCGL